MDQHLLNLHTIADSTTSGDFPISTGQETRLPPLIQQLKMFSSTVQEKAKWNFKKLKGLPIDLTVVIDGVNFHLHKVPFLITGNQANSN
ncbi:hypothetical protein R6Q59_016942 [Mikania micrantha]|uniref:Uncharacterized protein n=1 Tax=Mikania micrantha TaxID=192012 RepID=A0A5N6M5N1_9ASTR|nr:hypothetical protein E3N88_36952 [Mikania micrantha]